ncbi:MAG: hypothetical protein AMS18_09070 [Gemmatimonas sp. SG8_17]|nr:MAG: hypothetical protein AMS18_09070 [Gemmatimonas sp. SG8_17]
MTLRPIHIFATGAAVLFLMVLFPPYFGVYDQTGVNRHTGLGWHPIWNPPSQAEAYATIHGASPDAAQPESGDGVTRSVEERLALTRVAFNKVGFVMQVIVLGMAATVASVVAGQWRRRKDE